MPHQLTVLKSARRFRSVIFCVSSEHSVINGFLPTHAYTHTHKLTPTCIFTQSVRHWHRHVQKQTIQSSRDHIHIPVHMQRHR